MADRARWEYKTEILTSIVGRDKLRMDALEEALKKAGDAGWELVNLDIDADVRGARDGHLLVCSGSSSSRPASAAARCATLLVKDRGH